MQALTVKEPWLSCILFYGKDIENRSYKFPSWAINKAIALHTSKAVDKNQSNYLQATHGIAIDNLLPLGRIIVIAKITKSSIHMQSPWAVVGNHHWHITVDFILPTPLPAKGQLGLWQIPAEIELAILDQLKNSTK